MYKQKWSLIKLDCSINTNIDMSRFEGLYLLLDFTFLFVCIMIDSMTCKESTSKNSQNSDSTFVSNDFPVQIGEESLLLVSNNEFWDHFARS